MVTFTRAIDSAYAEILTPEAVAFLVALSEKFDARREELLAKRAVRWEELRRGVLPGFLPETAAVRSGDWKVAAIPAALMDRRVEITGPVDRKMVINELNSGASVFMADFEDGNSAQGSYNLEGEVN